MLDKYPNDFWKIFNKIVDGNNANDIKLIEEGKLIDNEKEIAKKMNEVFHEKVEKIHKEIPNIKNESPTERLEKQLEGRDLYFSLKPVSVSLVKKVIRNRRPSMSSGHIDLPQKIMKNAATILSIPLQTIINQSIRESNFPTEWKTAILHPTYKKTPVSYTHLTLPTNREV